MIDRLESPYVDRIVLDNIDLRELARGGETHVAGESGAWTTIDGSEVPDDDFRRIVAGEPVEARSDDGLFELMMVS